MWKTIGHKNNLNFLKAQLKQNSLSSCYIFFGPPSVGKFTTALDFSKSILCDNGNVDRKIHPDFMLIEDIGKPVSIAIAREVKKQIAFLPTLSLKKVILFENASLLTLDAQNALLKTLEEPPPYAIIILVAQKENLLPTILSRCQKLYFQPIPYKEIFAVLKKQGIEEREASFLAHISFGRYGLLVKEKEFKKRFLLSFDLLFGLIFANLKNKMDYVKNPNLSDIPFWTMIFRDVLYFKNNPNVIKYYPGEILKKILKISENYSQNRIKDILNKLIKTDQMLCTTLNQRLVLENLMLLL